MKKSNLNGLFYFRPPFDPPTSVRHFFTTRQTGQWTGFGLSLCYDTIFKGHGGKMDMETTEGAGTIFNMLIPIKK
jgi:signal transduction histidine kinase